MTDQQSINYNRIAKAIEYVKANFKSQPNLEEIAAELHLSPFHFQRLFTEWAGTSPKKFLQYLSVGHAKRLLKDQQATLFEAAYQTGLSGTGRLHDLFVKIEGMTPAEYKQGGRGLIIRYSFADCQFGKLILASTPKGVCYMAFYEDEKQALSLLNSQFPNASFVHVTDTLQQNALSVFSPQMEAGEVINLHLRGTVFQLKVWEALLKIPMGSVTNYGTIARSIDSPKASRAVGSAIGDNPIAFVIPCHRVIQSSGIVGGYMWGSTRKSAMIGWECAQKEKNNI
ncbi:MAG: bifunctional transcriptional activator/DNA repair enzyme AdaA [Cyclobacteriaceae bacterium]